MQKYLWKKSGLVVIGMLYLFLAWKGKRMIMVSGQELVQEPQEARKVALTFDDDVIIGLSQEISYKEAVSMI